MRSDHLKNPYRKKNLKERTSLAMCFLFTLFTLQILNFLFRRNYRLLTVLLGYNTLRIVLTICIESSCSEIPKG